MSDNAWRVSRYHRLDLEVDCLRPETTYVVIIDDGAIAYRW